MKNIYLHLLVLIGLWAGALQARPITNGRAPAAAPTFTYTKVDVLCNGEATGQISVSAVGGTGSYLYSVDNGFSYQADKQFNNLLAGEYKVVVKDGANALSAVQTITIGQPSALSLTVTKSDVSCFEKADGRFLVVATGGKGPYTYDEPTPASIGGPGGAKTVLSKGAGGARARAAAGYERTNLAAGTYYISVTDANGCSAYTFVEIQEPEQLRAEIYPSKAVTCKGSATGTIQAQAYGGTEPFRYSIDNGATYQNSGTFSGLKAGVYTIRIRDKNDCEYISGEVELTEPEGVTFSLAKTDVKSCFGDKTGSIAVTVTGGSEPFDYSKDGGLNFQSTNTFTGLGAGVYQVVVKEAGTCLSAPQSVTISQPPLLSQTVSTTNVTGCYGNANGSLSVSASGGSGSYQYSINDGSFQSSPLFTGLKAGFYTVTVKDANGCVSAGQSVSLTQPSAVVYTTSQTNIACAGGSTGRLSVSASGGSGSYRLSVNGGALSPVLSVSGLSAGVYSVSVVDGQGCASVTGVKTLTLTQPRAVSLTVDASGALCNGTSTGSLTVVASGGVGSYSYSKDGGQSYQGSNVLTGLGADVYQVKIKDGNGCESGVQSVTVSQPSALSLSVASQGSLINCTGTASVTVTAVGGAGGYQYSIDGGQNYQGVSSFTGVSSGVYQVKVKDANGCTSGVRSVTVVLPPPLSLSVLGRNDVTGCYGNTNGSFSLSAVGGVGTYQYSKDNGETFQASGQFGGLGAGTYYVKVKDASGCVTEAQTVTINQPSAIVASVSSVTQTCPGLSKGAMSVSATGGTGPYQYSLNNGDSFQNSPLFTGLAAGYYPLAVKDNNGCVVKPATYQITSSVAPTVTPQVTDASCNGTATGSILVNVTGGADLQQVYASIDNGSTYSTNLLFNGLSANLYTVVVRYGNNCTTAPQNKVVNQPAALSQTVSTTNVTGCYGNANGSLSVSASGGSGSYQYSINDGSFQSSPLFTGLKAGFYTVTVKDVNGCVSAGQSVSLTQPSAVVYTTSQTNIACAGGSTGRLSVSASGGSGSYRLSVNGGALSPVLSVSGLSAGVYSVSVVDGQGCASVTGVKTLTLTQPRAVSLTVDASGALCNGTSTGSLTVVGSGGVGSYSYSKDGGSYQASGIFGGLSAGVYQVRAKDGNGCVSEVQSVTVSQPSALSLTVGVDVGNNSNTVNCYGALTVTISVTGLGGVGGYQYSVNNGQSYQAGSTFSGLAAGSYQVKVKDANGCESGAKSVLVSQPSAVSLSVASRTSVSCYGNTDGSFSLSAVGGVGTYQYSKDNGETFQASGQFGGLGAGTYFVKAKDGNGCITPAQSVTITQPAPVNFDVSKRNPSCYGDDNGSITINATGGTTPYQYSIDNGKTFQAANTFLGLTASAYQVRVKDARGCVAATAVQSVTLTSPSALSVSTTQKNVSCFNTATGSYTVLVTGGTGPYQYSKDNGETYQATGEFLNLSAGYYPILVKDAGGCLAEAPSVELTQPASMSLDTQTTDVVSCSNIASGSIRVSVTGGNAPYRYAISSREGYQESPLFTGLTAGNYTVTVWDAGNCQTAVEVMIAPACCLSASASQSVIFNGQSTTLTASGCPNGTIIWSTDQSGSSIVVNPQQTTTYVATCSVSTSGSPVSCTAPVTVTVIDYPSCILAVKPSSTTVILGGTVSLTATGCSGTLRWSGGQTSSVITDAPTATRTYSVSCTIATLAGDVSCEASATVIVQERPVCTFALSASPATIVRGQSTTLTASGCPGGTVVWSTSQTGLSAIVSPTATTAYSASCTTATEGGSYTCPASVTVTVAEPLLQIAGSSAILPLNAASWAGTVTQNIGAFVWQYKIPGGNWLNFPPIFANNVSILVSATSILGGAAGTYLNQVIQLRAFSPLVVSNVLDVTIRQTPPAITAFTSLNAACAGISTGTFSLTLSRGLEPGESAFRTRVFSVDNGVETLITSYTFTGSTFTSPPGYGRGTFRIRLQSIVGTQGSDDFVRDFSMDEPPAVAGSATKINVLCYGGNDGVIDLTATGGTGGGYQFSVNGGTFQAFQSGGQQRLTGLSPAIYSISIRDGNGCKATQPVVVTIDRPSAPLTITGSSTKDPTGFGRTDGTITVQVSGGTPDYSFGWSAPSPVTSIQSTGQGVTHTIQNLGDGSYTVTVTDKYYAFALDKAGCMAQASYRLTQPPQIKATVAIERKISCASALDGTVAVSASGGVPRTSGTPYTYSWRVKTSGLVLAQTGSRLTGVGSNTYVVTVTDQNGVSREFEVYLAEPVPLATGIRSLADVSCFGAATGSVSLTVAGGTSPYKARWNNEQTGLSLTSLPAGNYLVVVTDSNNCQTQQMVQIRQPQALSLTLTTADPSCFDRCNGRIAASIAGGTAPYGITWQGLSTQALSLTGLCSGSYSLSVLDGKGCLTTQTAELKRPVEKKIVLPTNTIICKGQTVDFDATIPDGVQYLWIYPDGTTRLTPAVSVTNAGKYQVSATDKAGCLSTAQITLTASDTPAPALSFAVASQIGRGEPLVAVNLTNPKPTQSSWTFPTSASLVSSTEDRLELIFNQLGVYPITLKGTQGQCEVKATKTVTVVEASSVLANVQTTPFIQELAILPNPNDGTFRVKITLAEVSSVQLKVKDILSGTPLYQTSAANAQNYLIPVTIPNIATGVYILTLETPKAIQSVQLLIAR